MDYIVEFQTREQYDCNCNSVPKSIAKAFDEKATLGEIVDWVKDNAGTWFNDYNILSNPQIIGILKSRYVDTETNLNTNPKVFMKQDKDGNWQPT